MSSTSIDAYCAPELWSKEKHAQVSESLQERHRYPDREWRSRGRNRLLFGWFIDKRAVHPRRGGSEWRHDYAPGWNVLMEHPRHHHEGHHAPRRVRRSNERRGQHSARWPAGLFHSINDDRKPVFSDNWHPFYRTWRLDRHCEQRRDPNWRKRHV